MYLLMFLVYVVLSGFLAIAWVQTDVEISTLRLSIATVGLLIGWLDLFTGIVSGWISKVATDCGFGEWK